MADAFQERWVYRFHKTKLVLPTDFPPRLKILAAHRLISSSLFFASSAVQPLVTVFGDLKWLALRSPQITGLILPSPNKSHNGLAYGGARFGVLDLSTEATKAQGRSLGARGIT